MVKKQQPINASNTTLSPSAKNRHRKVDAKQAKRHKFGQAHCVICDRVFTKYNPRTAICSDECKRERNNRYQRKYRKENPERYRAHARKWNEENPERRRAINRKSFEKNRERVNARSRKWREENRDKVNAYHREYRKGENYTARQREYYQENLERKRANARRSYKRNRDKINARRRARYHAKKKEK